MVIFDAMAIEIDNHQNWTVYFFSVMKFRRCEYEIY